MTDNENILLEKLENENMESLTKREVIFLPMVKYVC
jgi:hypothetical protein